MYNIDLSILWGHWGLLLLHGLGTTLALSAWCLLFSLLIGLFFGVLRWSQAPFAEPICLVYLELTRTVPPLVQILFWYFSAAYLLPRPLYDYMRVSGFEFEAAVMALSIYHGSFMAEVIRAGLNSVPRGQSNAARALGLTFVDMMRFVILPQALRATFPPMMNEAVGLVKNTSLAMAIGVTEITHATKTIDSQAFRGIEALIGATVLYVLICSMLSALGHHAARALSRERRISSQARLVPSDEEGALLPRPGS